eukprot:359500-Chlamydomonas_euryale.AAC.6
MAPPPARAARTAVRRRPPSTDASPAPPPPPEEGPAAAASVGSPVTSTKRGSGTVANLSAPRRCVSCSRSPSRTQVSESVPGGPGPGGEAGGPGDGPGDDASEGPARVGAGASPVAPDAPDADVAGSGRRGPVRWGARPHHGGVRRAPGMGRCVADTQVTDARGTAPQWVRGFQPARQRASQDCMARSKSVAGIHGKQGKRRGTARQTRKASRDCPANKESVAGVHGKQGKRRGTAQ